MRKLFIFAALTGAIWAQQQAPEPPSGDTRKLIDRTETAAPAAPIPPSRDGLWVVPAGTKLPIQLRQPISTKTAQPGDAIYAQTSFPVVVGGNMVIPAGTWVQGAVDKVKRAGRVKGTAELQFHLTTLIYPNGYALDIAAAIDSVPGDQSASVKDEPGTVKQDSEKGKDLKRVGENASQAGQIGALAGAAAGQSVRSLGIGGLTGVAAGTLIALLTRGSDVQFATGTAVEIVLTRAMAVDPGKIFGAPNAASR